MTRTYVCLECGATAALRWVLEAHWHATGHGPRQRQADAIDRARYGLLGDDAPPPEDVYGSGHRPEHRP